jgi:hypothetical protein
LDIIRTPNTILFQWGRKKTNFLLWILSEEMGVPRFFKSRRVSIKSRHGRFLIGKMVAPMRSGDIHDAAHRAGKADRLRVSTVLCDERRL